MKIFLNNIKPLDIIREIEYNITTSIFIRSFDMIQYMSAREAAEKWNISQRRVSILCSECRIPDVAMLCNLLTFSEICDKISKDRAFRG